MASAPPSAHSGSLRIGRVFGVELRVHFSWLIVFALVTWTLATGYFPAYHPDLPAASYWAKALVAALLLFLSILIHEMGHALVALRHGIAIRSITLFIFGGVAQLEKDAGDGDTEFKVAVIGPVVSLVLAALFYLGSAAGAPGSGARGIARYLALINLVLALFNLLPAFPLDGGRVLRGLLWRSYGKARATQVAAGAGTFFAYLLMAAGALRFFGGDGIGGMWYVLIGWFLKDASAGTYQRVRLDETLRGVTVADAMLTEPATLPPDISLAEAAREHFMRSGYGAYPVVRDGRPVGLLGLRDLLQHPPEERESVSVQAAMTPAGEQVVASPREPLLSAMAKMSRPGGGRLLVVDDGRLVGLLTRGSVLRQVRVREHLAS